jgi:hypothetical protein
MADNTSRWDRVNEKPAEKPAFSPRQSTESFRQPTQDSSRRSGRSRRHSRGRSGKTWFLVGVVVLALLAGILAWQLFAA